MRVAVVGKGGAGKSVVTGTIARLLARRGRKVLALDSDPMPGLALSLGLGPVTTAMLAEAAEKDADGRWRLKKGVGAARAVQRHSLLAPDGVRLLQFGKPSSEGKSASEGKSSSEGRASSEGKPGSDAKPAAPAATRDSKPVPAPKPKPGKSSSE